MQKRYDPCGKRFSPQVEICNIQMQGTPLSPGISQGSAFPVKPTQSIGKAAKGFTKMNHFVLNG